MNNTRGRSGVDGVFTGPSLPRMPSRRSKAEVKDAT
jgi:hypothetical protein